MLSCPLANTCTCVFAQTMTVNDERKWGALWFINRDVNEVKGWQLQLRFPEEERPSSTAHRRAGGKHSLLSSFFT